VREGDTEGTLFAKKTKLPPEKEKENPLKGKKRGSLGEDAPAKGGPLFCGDIGKKKNLLVKTESCDGGKSKEAGKKGEELMSRVEHSVSDGGRKTVEDVGKGR